MLQIQLKRRKLPFHCIYHKKHSLDWDRMNEASVFTSMGHLIEVIGSPRYPAALAALFRLAVPYTYTVVFGYLGTARPLDLFDDFPASKRKVFVTDYLIGPYLLDPFYLAANRPMPPGLYRLRDLAPDRFYQGEYYRNYYARTGLAEEIGFFVDIAPNAVIVVSLMRAERAFSSKDIRALQELAPAVIASARRQWAGLSVHPPTEMSANVGTETKVEQSFASFGQGVLTPREREIVEHTLKGHSAEAIGNILKISSGTVRIHRRNVYAKLRISSQGELFSKFIQALGRA